MSARGRAPGAWLALTLAAAGAPASADDLVTDRPDFTESASTVARGRVQLEGGYTFTRGDGADEHALGELLLRLGMTEVLELRLGLNSYVWQDLPGRDVSGLEDMTVGVKALLGIPPPAGSRRPRAAVLVGTSVDTGSDALGQDGLQPQVTLALAWDLDSDTSLGSNLGYAYLSADGDRVGELSGSVALGRSLGDRLGGFVEYFAFAREGAGGDDHFVDAGITWLLSPDSQLDVRAGAGLNSGAADFFVGAGAAWRW